MGNSLSIRELLGLKTYEQLAQDGLDALANGGAKVTSLVVGGTWRSLLEIALEPVAELHALFGAGWRKSFLRYATGGFVDLIAEGLGLKRQEATKAVHQVEMARESSVGNLTVEAGKIVGTKVSAEGDQLRFFVAQQVVSPDGQLTVDVEVKAEFPGSRYNVGEGYITELITPISGIASVTNAADSIVTQAADRESDDRLKDRCYGRFPSLSHGAVKEAYEAWALEVEGVEYVWVADQHPRGPGTIDVIVAAADGVPSVALVTEVGSFLETKRPMNDDVRVLGASPLNLTLNVELILHPTNGVAADIKEEAAKVAKAQFLGTDLHQNPDEEAEYRKRYDITPLGPGRDFIRQRCASHLMAIENVVDVNMPAPVLNQVAHGDQFYELVSLTVTSSRRSAL